MKRIKFCVFCLVVGLVLSIQTASAQSGIFNYQGSLRDGANPANGMYDFRFTVYSDPTGGSVLGGPVNMGNTPVANGIFSVNVPIGYAPFSGASRYLQVEVKVAGSATYTALNPRQFIADSPYSVKSQFSTDALQLGGIAANQYVTTTSGGANFIQNTTSQQTGSFNINGSGIIEGNLRLGPDWGGNEKLKVNGSAKFYRKASIEGDSSAAQLVFTRLDSPRWTINSDSTLNSLRIQSHLNNENVLWIDGISSNIGFGTNTPSQRLHVVGNGLFDGNGFFTGNLGVGTTTPGFRLDVVGRSRFRQNAGDTGSTNTAGFWFFQNTPNQDRAFVGMETDNSIGFFGTNGGGWGLVMNTQTGRTSVTQLGAAGATPLCRNASNEISLCSSSLRYKTNVNPFGSGLDLISRLRPVSFNWLANNQVDFGLVAEEVAAVEPLLATYNDKGEVEGVKYDRIGVIAVNAIKEQQAEISGQRSVISEQQRQIDDLKSQVEVLKTVVCGERPTLEICKPKGK
jgi:hypothetical protein